ncbi:MAG: FAD-dependent oxidoreductase [Gammaproteobacteria bacterium]|nr:FAD-dependent oxidoreductase [Gammaproteobacteria bacterium]
MQEHLLIVGAGQAAAQAVASLRQYGYEGRITLVGDETHAPYQRPPLSKKYLAGQMPRERLALRPARFYSGKGVELVLGAHAVELNPGARKVRLDDGRALDYDRLVLTTGSRVRRMDVPGATLAGVHYLRTIDDVDGIAPALRPGASLVLVGAGYIGLEVAAVAARLGVRVIVLEAGERVMSRVVCPLVSEYYDRRHRSEGVELHCGATVTSFVGRERVEAVETADGTRHACDLVVVGIGVVPNVELAEAAGLACANGIAVDEHARTADERIAAAGDCTSLPHPLAPGRVRLESVQNAVEQAKAAAASLAGTPRAYTDVPWFWSDQYDVKLQIAGLAEGADAMAVRGDPAAGSFAVCQLRDGVLVAVEAVNRPRDFMFGKRLIAAGWSGTAAALEDPELDLSTLVRPDS